MVFLKYSENDKKDYVVGQIISMKFWLKKSKDGFDNNIEFADRTKEMKMAGGRNWFPKTRLILLSVERKLR